MGIHRFNHLYNLYGNLAFKLSTNSIIAESAKEKLNNVAHKPMHNSLDLLMQLTSTADNYSSFLSNYTVLQHSALDKKKYACSTDQKKHANLIYKLQSPHLLKTTKVYIFHVFSLNLFSSSIVLCLHKHILSKKRF